MTPPVSEHGAPAVRALFISGSLGLGHTGRDLAIARELRELRPDIQIDWLAGPPANDQLGEAGERLLPESRVFADTAIAERAASAFSLNLVSYATRAAVAWARVATTVLRLVRTGRYRLVVGDETYELAVAFALRRSLKTVPWVVIYDFFGLDATSLDRLREEDATVGELQEALGASQQNVSSTSASCTPPAWSPVPRTATTPATRSQTPACSRCATRSAAAFAASFKSSRRSSNRSPSPTAERVGFELAPLAGWRHVAPRGASCRAED